MISFKDYVVLPTVVPITIDQVGSVPAKVDSGNDSYNVLHGHNIAYKDNGTITFTTVNGKNLEKKIVDRITINIGAGTTEERPLVEFDCSINGRSFASERFSISDRKNNSEKCLLGVKFLQKLKCLIKV